MSLDRVPWFGRHVENLGDIIIYPVLVVARTVDRAVARFYVTGSIIASAEGKSLVQGSGGILSQKIVKFVGSEGYFQHLL